jgi:two-component system, NtrC family, response regulator AtoC
VRSHLSADRGAAAVNEVRQSQGARERILVTDDDPVSCELFAEVLEGEGYRVDRALSGEDALQQLHRETYALLLVDVRLPGISGLEVTRTVRTTHPDLPIVVMTAFGSMEIAIEAIREGAFDYTSKPMNLEELKHTVARALVQHSAAGWGRQAGGDGDDIAPLGTIIGRSPAMVDVYKTVARAAATKSTVLILGESGTGKELMARALHQHSPRSHRPFVAVDCGAMTESLLESELFGHVRGAFTGAFTDKRGVFEEAATGTCFLDEIGDITPNMQAKLLRVLQENEIRRVGGQKWIKVDVRILAATNKDLMERVKQGTFRQDLFYRVNVVTIHLPALRQRAEDIPALAYHFLRRYSQEHGKAVVGISADAMTLLRTYNWPGNIRELENIIERAVALSNQGILTPEDLPVEVRDGAMSGAIPNRPSEAWKGFDDLPSLEEVKKRYILRVLESTQGNISRAAEILEIDRRSLYRMLERYHVAPARHA